MPAPTDAEPASRLFRKRWSGIYHRAPVQTFLDTYRYRFILANLVAKEFKTLYRSMALGLFWALLQPLFLVAVLSVVFVFFYKQADFPSFVIVCLIPYNFISYTVSASANVILSNRGLVKKVRFPRQILPISVVATHAIHFAIQSILIVGVLLIFPPHAHVLGVQLLWLPAILVVHLGLAVGLSLLVSGTNVVYRDVHYLVDSLMTLLFWLSPILYDARSFLLNQGAPSVRRGHSGPAPLRLLPQPARRNPRSVSRRALRRPRARRPDVRHGDRRHPVDRRVGRALVLDPRTCVRRSGLTGSRTVRPTPEILGVNVLEWQMRVGTRAQRRDELVVVLDPFREGQRVLRTEVRTKPSRRTYPEESEDPADGAGRIVLAQLLGVHAQDAVTYLAAPSEAGLDRGVPLLVLVAVPEEVLHPDPDGSRTGLLVAESRPAIGLDRDVQRRERVDVVALDQDLRDRRVRQHVVEHSLVVRMEQLEPDGSDRRPLEPVATLQERHRIGVSRRDIDRGPDSERRLPILLAVDPVVVEQLAVTHDPPVRVQQIDEHAGPRATDADEDESPRSPGTTERSEHGQGTGSNLTNAGAQINRGSSDEAHSMIRGSGMSAIRFQNVSKAFVLDHQRPFLAREVLRRIVSRDRADHRHWALRDISFEIGDGETVGVIGANGSGKSTLLALMAGTSYPTSGLVAVNGRIGPLLELGAGFHPLLTGEENIVLNASLLGMSREEVESRLDSIIDYSELRPFIDTPIAKYSTGMVARLGFAVLAHMRPDVLLIDEALSVGDARFSAKCEETIQEFLRSGTTVVIVSHNLPSIERLCRRAIWIDNGELRADGPAHDVCTRVPGNTSTNRTSSAPRRPEFRGRPSARS